MATQEEILSALTQLDSGNDEHWTDDGLPRVDVLQKLTRDPDLRRKDINEASPGFARARPGATTEPEDVQPGDPEAAPAVEATDMDEDEVDPIDILGEQELDEDELRRLMQKRATAATERLAKARAALTDAATYVRKCEAWEGKALRDLHHRFPPMHENDAIKQHLDSQLRLRYERAGHTPSQIDEAMGMRKRPTRARVTA